MATQEFNFDGLVGPTHNYAGLSHGNVASTSHKQAVSSPQAAALQGLQKMKFVRDLGIVQCVLPPLPRPKLSLLRDLGFSGSDQQLIEKAWQTDPVLVAACYSASNMWTANAATVSPRFDCHDNRLHLTPANLASNLHRSLEGPHTQAILQAIFSDPEHFQVHSPLPYNLALTDEGAANHTRLCHTFDGPGVELFVHGCEFLNRSSQRPTKYPARQTLEANQALVRLHKLDPSRVALIQQNPAAIDAGVFHNDVISVGHQNVLLCHEMAFLDQERVVEQVSNLFAEHCGADLHVVTIPAKELSLADTVSSYLFNSQIVTRSDGVKVLICPADCETNESAKACTQQIVESDNPIEAVNFLDLRQSMNNGGGPACLRLRVVLDDVQQQKMLQSVDLTDALYDELVAWVKKHYRDQLSAEDLRDPKLMVETRDANEALGKILSLPLADLD